jgi:hypothetical protein
MFSHPAVVVVVFAIIIIIIIIIIILVKLFCTYHEIIYMWTVSFEPRPFFPGEEPPAVIEQEEGGPQFKSVCIREEKQSAVLANSRIKIPCFCTC